MAGIVTPRPNAIDFSAFIGSMAGSAAHATSTVTKLAPNSPSQDFLGLMVGASGRLPQMLPTRNAMMS